MKIKFITYNFHNINKKLVATDQQQSVFQVENRSLSELFFFFFYYAHFLALISEMDLKQKVKLIGFALLC